MVLGEEKRGEERSKAEREVGSCPEESGIVRCIAIRSGGSHGDEHMRYSSWQTSWQTSWQVASMSDQLVGRMPIFARAQRFALPAKASIL